VVKTSEDGEILEKAEIFDYAQVQRMIAMRKAREAARLRYEKELRKKRGEVDFAADEDEEKTEKKKKKKKKKKKNKKSTPGEQESLEAIAKRLAKQEIKDQNHFENEDDSDVFGESTSSDAASQDGNSDTESDFDEKEAKKEKERHDKLLKLHVKNLQKAEKKVVRESVKTKLGRLFNRNKGGKADPEREKKKQSFL
tara:strand:- start:1957 stop:2547 length:591 start_codon:yes stop_codon:yes gene_type:complete